MGVLLETYYILLPIIATALVGWVGFLLKDQKKKEKVRDDAAKKKEQEIASIRKANSEGIKLVLRYMLQRYHTEYMIQGKITYSQYKEWIDIHNAYTALHGNSIADEWHEDIENMEKCDHTDTIPAFEALMRKSMEKHN